MKIFDIPVEIQMRYPECKLRNLPLRKPLQYGVLLSLHLCQPHRLLISTLILSDTDCKSYKVPSQATALSRTSCHTYCIQSRSLWVAVLSHARYSYLMNALSVLTTAQQCFDLVLSQGTLQHVSATYVSIFREV